VTIATLLIYQIIACLRKGNIASNFTIFIAASLAAHWQLPDRPLDNSVVDESG